MECPIDYDPLLAKLIGYGRTAISHIAAHSALSDILWAGSRRTFRCFGASCAIRISGLPNLIRDFSTGCLKRTEDRPVDSGAAEVAAICRGMFAALGSTAAAAGERAVDSSSRAADCAVSKWKNAVVGKLCVEAA